LTFLQSVEKELSLKGTGTIFGGISGKVLIELPISLPPLEEQKQIAALVSKHRNGYGAGGWAGEEFTYNSKTNCSAIYSAIKKILEIT
jgi:hypothetical protein